MKKTEKQRCGISKSQTDFESGSEPWPLLPGYKVRRLNSDNIIRAS